MTVTINGSGTITGATTLASTVASPTMTSPTMTGAVVSAMGSSVITAGTAVASTSGTSIDFTGIPSWVKRITVMFNQVSTNGTSVIHIRFGVSGIVSSGYAATASYFLNAGTANIGTYTTGFPFALNVAAANTVTGTMVLQNMGSNTWNAYCLSNAINGTYTQTSMNGAIGLSGAPDTVRITTINGTDTFDAGSINILYE